MKKKVAVALTLTMLAGALVACGKTAKTEAGTETATEAAEEGSTGAVYVGDVKASDYVTLGEYKGVEVTVADPEVTDDYLNEYIEYVLQNSPVTTEITDRAVVTGDTVNIDFEGKVDGTAFEGGTAAGVDLTIGSGQMIAGFEEGIVGMAIGETKDIDVTFPDDYRDTTLAGKAAVFTITVNSIGVQSTPELTDEYVAGLGIENVTNVEEYNTYMYDLLMEQAQSTYETDKMNAVVEAVAANCEFKEMPEAMVSRMNETLSSNLNSYAQMAGMDLASYMTYYYGLTSDDYAAEIMSQSNLTAQRYIMLQAIADIEGIALDEAELETQMEAEATEYGYENVDAYKAAIDVDAYKEYQLTQKVMTFLVDNATIIAE